ncbi:MAG: hypothetical protein QOJ29_2899 [Thermoleophilaceae bacterium]|nr:hypothetical protein [Thermoleophilaceae bacterium]
MKFQNYRTEDFIQDRTLTYEYENDGRAVVELQWDMFKRCELDSGSLAELKAHCDEREVVFFSTPTSAEGVAELAGLGAPLLKNGSDFLTNIPLVEAMARSGIPTVLSTGMATAGDIDDSVRAFRAAGGTELILLQCTSRYPTPPADVNLRQIDSLGRTFGCPVGFSDHTEGVVAAAAAVALGACFVEKHFSLDRSLPGPDHRFSMDPAELGQLVAAVRTAEQALGHSEIGPTRDEEASRASYRLSCVAARDLEAGSVIDQDAIAFARPGTGMPPKGARWIAGRTLARAVPAGQPFAPEDLA